MRAYIPDYELRTEKDLAATLALLDQEPGSWRPFAGGTDLMVQLESGRLAHTRYVSIWHLAELRGIQATDRELTIGALTTYTDVQAHEVIRREFPMLVTAASETGAIAIQNRGTIGGNIANASPAADSPPALLCYDAEVELVSAKGTRRVPYAQFHKGYKKMDLRPDELLARVRLPRPTAGAVHYYRKVGTRRAQSISKVVLAGLARVEGGTIRGVRVALGSVAPTTVRCPRAEGAIEGSPVPFLSLDAAVNALGSDIAPIDDIRSTARYRRRIAENLLIEFIQRINAT